MRHWLHPLIPSIIPSQEHVIKNPIIVLPPPFSLWPSFKKSQKKSRKLVELDPGYDKGGMVGGWFLVFLLVFLTTPPKAESPHGWGTFLSL